MYGINTHLLPSCYDYDSARRVYDKAVQFSKKGDDGLPGTERGLKDRRSKHMTVFVDKHDAVIFKLYRTHMVTWARPDRVVVTCHNTQSSVGFVNRFLPQDIYANMHRGYMRLNGCVPQKDSIAFDRDGSVWTPWTQDVKQEYDMRLDLKAAARVRKLISPFLEWYEAMTVLRGHNLARLAHHVGKWERLSVARELIKSGAIPESKYKDLYRVFVGANPRTITEEFYAVSGAVQPVALALGQLPRRPKWTEYTTFIPPQQLV